MYDQNQNPIPNYIRCNATYLLSAFRFEIDSQDTLVAILTIETGDGPLQIAVNRAAGTQLAEQLSRMLAELGAKN